MPIIMHQSKFSLSEQTCPQILNGRHIGLALVAAILKIERGSGKIMIKHTLYKPFNNFFYTVRTFLQPQIPTILALSFRIVAILNLRLLSAILKFEIFFINILFKHSMKNINANCYALEQVFNAITNLPHDFEWPPYWIGSSGRHLENRTWV